MQSHKKSLANAAAASASLTQIAYSCLWCKQNILLHYILIFFANLILQKYAFPSDIVATLALPLNPDAILNPLFQPFA